MTYNEARNILGVILDGSHSRAFLRCPMNSFEYLITSRLNLLIQSTHSALFVLISSPKLSFIVVILLENIENWTQNDNFELQLNLRFRSNLTVYLFIAYYNASHREHTWQYLYNKMDIKWREAAATPSGSANLIQDSLDNMPRLSIGKALLILLSCEERDFNLALSKQHEYSGN